MQVCFGLSMLRGDDAAYPTISDVAPLTRRNMVQRELCSLGVIYQLLQSRMLRKNMILILMLGHICIPHGSVDQEVGNNNEPSKRQRRRWFSETIKVPKLQASALQSSHEDAFPSDAPKRSIDKSDSTLSPKTAQERVVPPSAKPPKTSLRIDNFLRPFTLKAVQELMVKTDTVCSLWMDHIKTHCYVTYSSVKEVTETRNALYNLQWPTNGGKLLVADFVDP